MLHHFGSKEKLYGEVLATISKRLTEQLTINQEQSSFNQVEAMFIQFLNYCVSHRLETQILIRELMDNRERAEVSNNWYLKPFLEQVTTQVMNDASNQFDHEAEAFAFVYHMLGSISYFAISETTITQMYDVNKYKEFAQNYEMEVRKMIRARLEGC